MFKEPKKQVSLTKSNVQDFKFNLFLASLAHVLSTTQAFDGTTCSAINPSLVLEAPYGECTADCLTTIVPYMYTNGTSFGKKTAIFSMNKLNYYVFS